MIPQLLPAARLWLARDPVAVVALTLGAIAAAVPIWTPDLLPMMDLPQHLATVRVLHSWNDPTFGVDKWHVIDFARTQYLSWYVAVDLLAWLLPLETAARVVLTGYAVGLPLAMALLLRAHGRDPLLALLAVPLVYNVFWFAGFANWLSALPLLLVTLALVRRAVDVPTWPRVAALTMLALLLFYTHAQAFAHYCVLACVTVALATRGPHPRHWWRVGLHIVPAASALAGWTIRSLVLADAAQWHAGHGGRNVAPAEVEFEPWLDALHNLVGWWLDAYRGDADEGIALAWLALFGWAAWLAQRAAAPVPPVTNNSSTSPDDTGLASPLPGPFAEKIPLALFLVTVATYFCAPVSYKWIWPISYRIVPMIALFAIPALQCARLGRRPWTRAVGFALPALALAAWTAAVHVEHGELFSQEAGPIRQIVARAEPAKRLISLVHGPGSEVLNQGPMLHLGQYYVVDRGGMASFSFANYPQSPIVYPDLDGPPPFPPRFEWTPEAFNWHDHGWWYDYVLVRGADDAVEGDRAHFERIADMPPYRLYRNLRPGWRG
ncbi:MAG: hypothetical protein EXR79_04725 [Myxococcales bacterium]|nr:hypothetical protein [Myxococcales bacterium]